MLGERITSIHFGSFLKGTWSFLNSRGSRSVNWLKSGNWLRDCDSLFLWFRLDFYSLDFELFCLCRSSKNLVSFLLISLLKHHDQLDNAINVWKLDYSDCCSDSAAIMVANPCCLWVLSALTWLLCLRVQLLPVNLFLSCVAAVPSVRSTAQSNPRALQGCEGSPHKLISHSHGERCLLDPWVWVSRSEMINPLTFQSL